MSDPVEQWSVRVVRWPNVGIVTVIHTSGAIGIGETLDDAITDVLKVIRDNRARLLLSMIGGA